MRVLIVFGAVLLAAISGGAAPTDDDSLVPSADPSDSTVPGYRKETLDTVSRNSSAENVKSSTKEKEKVKVKHLKNGGTITYITDTSKTKTKKDSVSDQYSQTNHTLTEDGLEDSSSLTQEKQHEVKETDTIKKKDREVIVRDKDGNVISDKKKEKVKEKTKKKEKNKASESYIHTVKQVAPPTDDVDTPPPSDC